VCRNPAPSASLRNSTDSSNRGSTTMSARHEPSEANRELGTLEEVFANNKKQSFVTRVLQGEEAALDVLLKTGSKWKQVLGLSDSADLDALRQFRIRKKAMRYMRGEGMEATEAFNLSEQEIEKKMAPKKTESVAPKLTPLLKKKPALAMSS
jgi:hypothetical protein